MAASVNHLSLIQVATTDNSEEFVKGVNGILVNRSNSIRFYNSILGCHGTSTVSRAIRSVSG